jgi:hypothetical protein
MFIFYCLGNQKIVVLLVGQICATLKMQVNNKNTLYFLLFLIIPMITFWEHFALNRKFQKISYLSGP